MFQALSRLSITRRASCSGPTRDHRSRVRTDNRQRTRSGRRRRWYYKFDLALLVRIGVAVALAFPIGWEREFRGSEAGDRTFMLVSLGAAAFTAVGVENFPATAEKIMAGVVTGVGFLGGGMILKDGGDVRGLTTAAAIWATSAVGMLAGDWRTSHCRTGDRLGHSDPGIAIPAFDRSARCAALAAEGS